MHHLPAALERLRYRAEEKRERKKFSAHAGRKAERSNSAIQNERMRIRRGADRGGDTKRQACAAKAA